MKTSTIKSSTHAAIALAISLFAAAPATHAEPIAITPPAEITAPVNFLSASDIHSPGFTTGQGATLNLTNGVAIGTAASRATGVGSLASLISLGGNNGAHSSLYGSLIFDATAAPFSMYGENNDGATGCLVGVYVKTLSAPSNSLVNIGSTTQQSVIDLVWGAATDASWFNAILAESKGDLAVNIVNTRIATDYTGAGAGNSNAAIHINSGWGTTGTASLTTDALTSITTVGNKAHAMRVSYDNIAIINNAATLATNGTGAHGIYLHGAQPGSGTANNSGAITTVGNGSHGIYAETAYSGDISITNTGEITTSGTGAHGINAFGRSVTNITISNTADITASLASSRGIYALSEQGGIRIENTGNIASNTAYGIHAIGKGVASDVTIIHSGTIRANNAGNPANDLVGINAWQEGGVGRAMNVTTLADSFIEADRGITVHTGGAGANGAYGRIINAADIVATHYGLQADLSTADSIIENTGNINNTNISPWSAGTGIKAITSGTGNITIASNGDGITTGSITVAGGQTGYGIRADAQNGDIRIGYTTTIDSSGLPSGTYTEKALTGSITTHGDASHAITASTSGTGNIAILSAANITTTGSNSHGIYATTVATGSSNITIIQSSGTIKTANGAGIYAKGNDGNITIDTTGATLDINNDANPNHLAGGTGILGYGSGNVSITTGAGAINLGTNSDDALLAISTGTGSVTVNNAANISHTGTRGDHYGIVAISGYNGGGISGGDVSVTNSGNISTAGGDALYAESRFAGRNVTINNSGSLGTTSAAGSAIRAVAGANSTGTITISNSGAITAINHGIYASTAGSGDTIINNDANITSTGLAGKGINAVASNGGSIDINNTGDITTTNGGNTAIGVRAPSITATASGSGSINITNAGNLAYAGWDSDGIAVASSYGNIAIVNSGSLVGVHDYNDGVQAISSYGAIDIINSGNIQSPADFGDGLFAEIEYSSTNNITLTSAANITTGGNESIPFRIYINSMGSTGDVRIGYTNNGDGTYSEAALSGTITASGSSSHGIDTMNAGSGNIHISNNADITASGAAAKGIQAIGTGSTMIANYASISGNAQGIHINGAKGGLLANTGTITGLSGTAILTQAKNVLHKFDTGSVLNGDVYSTGTGNTLAFQGTVTEDSAFLATGGTVNNFASLTVQTDGTNNTRWTLTGSSTQLDAVNAIAINDGAANTTATLAINPSDAANYTFSHALSGNGTLEIALQNAADTISFGTVTGNAFTGTVALGNSQFVLGGTANSTGATNLATLQNATLRLDSGNRTAVESVGTIGGLAFNTGTLAVRTSATGGMNRVDDLLTVTGTLDVTGGGTVEVTLSGTAQNIIPPTATAPSLLDQDDYLVAGNDPSGRVLNQLVAATPGNVNGVGSQVTVVNFLPSATNISALTQSGTHVANLTYDYIGSVRDDGIYLGYGLSQIEALAGKTVLVSNNGATDNTLGARLTGTGNFNFAATGAAMRIGNGLSNYTGATTISSGTVVAITNNALGQTTRLDLTPGTVLDLNGNTQTVHGQITVNTAEIKLGANGKLIADIDATTGYGVAVTKGKINADGAGAFSGTIKTSAPAGIGLFITGSGSEVRASNLAIETHGAGNSYGIISQLAGAAFTGSNITITTTGDRGIGAVAERGGTINLAHATIDVQNAPVDNSGGIVSWTTGTEAISTVNASDIQVTSIGRGITASEGSIVNLSGAANTITTTGTASHALQAAGINGTDTTKRATINAANTTFKTTGAGAHGIVASAANITLAASAIKTTGANADGILSVSSTVAPTTITGSNTAIDAAGRAITITGTGNTTVTLTGGSLKSGGDLINATHTTGTATVAITGPTAVTAGSGTLLAATGGGVTNATFSKATLAGDIIADAASLVNLSLTNTTALTGRIDPVNVNIDATSSWTMTASSEVNNLALATGAKVSFGTPGAANTAFKTLRVRGNMSAGANTIVMSTNLGLLRGDLLRIDGITTGTYTLDLTNYGGNPSAAGQSLLVVQAANPADFKLTGNQYRDAGLYRYYWQQGETDPSNWYLANPTGDDDEPSPYSDAGQTIVNSASLLGLSWHYGMDALHKRMGDVRLENNPAAKSGNVWLRAYNYRLNAQSPMRGSAFSQDTYGLTGGADKAFRNDDSRATWLLGGFLDMGNTNRDFRNADSGSTTNLGAGLYATWLHDNGWYADIVLRFDRYKHDIDSRPLGSASMTGDYKSKAQGFSVEFGRTFKRTDGWWVEPSVQLSQGWLNGTTYTSDSADAANRITVRVGDTDTLQYRGMLRAGRQFKDTRWYPYGKLAAARVDSNGGEVTALDTRFSPTYGGWRLEAGFGTAYRLNETSQVYFDYEYAKSATYERPWAVNLGYRQLW